MSPLPFTGPNRSHPLVPEDLPWLAHTIYWKRFSHIERLRANQLMGLLVNELGLAVERGLIGAGLQHLQHLPLVRTQPELMARWHELRDDEERHASWFAAFNHHFAPEIYGPAGWCFIAPAPWMIGLAKCCAGFPGAWRITIWLVLATEEWSCGLAQALAEEPIGELGARDADFVRLHGMHAREERRHLRVDEQLLALAAAGVPVTMRRAVVGLVRVMVAQLMRPKRAAPLMIDRFVEEFPRWRSESAAMLHAVRVIGKDPNYWQSQGVTTTWPITSRTALEWGLAWNRPLGASHE
jgi:hypothetical protein